MITIKRKTPKQQNSDISFLHQTLNAQAVEIEELRKTKEQMRLDKNTATRRATTVVKSNRELCKEVVNLQDELTEVRIIFYLAIDASTPFSGKFT
jgi:hypothetical protein